MQADSRLRRPWLTIARVTWVALVAPTVVLFAAGLLLGLGQLRTVCAGGVCHPEQLSPAQAELHQQLGLSLDFYAWYTTIVFAVFGCVFFAVGVLIFWRRSDDRMALFVSLFLVMLGASAVPVIASVGMIQAPLGQVGSLMFGLCVGLLPAFIALFPDGRFVPRWMRWLVLAWLVRAGVPLVMMPDPSLAGGALSGPPNASILVVLATCIGAQVYRYRRVSTPLQRQQTKWAVLGFGGFLVSLLAIVLALAFFPALTHHGLPGLVFGKYIVPVAALPQLLIIPVTIAISMLRYRLWDVDFVINRALVYSVLTGLLALAYFGSVVSLQGLFRALTGQEQSPIVTVFSTLAIAAMFGPVRRRVQNAIDRRFYRRKYDAAKTLAEFAATCRDETDLDKLTERLVAVVQETMQPAHVSLWLKKASSPPSAPPLPTHSRRERGIGGEA